MQIKITAIEGDRLDQVVQDTLGTLKSFKEVLELNPSLRSKIFLNEGDVVILPKVENIVIIEDELW
jgi:hypothetical protein